MEHGAQEKSDHRSLFKSADFQKAFKWSLLGVLFVYCLIWVLAMAIPPTFFNKDSMEVTVWRDSSHERDIGPWMFDTSWVFGGGSGESPGCVTNVYNMSAPPGYTGIDLNFVFAFSFTGLCPPSDYLDKWFLLDFSVAVSAIFTFAIFILCSIFYRRKPLKLFCYIAAIVLCLFLLLVLYWLVQPAVFYSKPFVFRRV